MTLQLTRTRQIRGFVVVSATYYTLHVADALSLANTKVSSKREKEYENDEGYTYREANKIKKSKNKIGRSRPGSIMKRL